MPFGDLYRSIRILLEAIVDHRGKTVEVASGLMRSQKRILKGTAPEQRRAHLWHNPKKKGFTPRMDEPFLKGRDGKRHLARSSLHFAMKAGTTFL